jgi:hypothetical protein
MMQTTYKLLLNRSLGTIAKHINFYYTLLEFSIQKTFFFVALWCFLCAAPKCYANLHHNKIYVIRKTLILAYSQPPRKISKISPVVPLRLNPQLKLVAMEFRFCFARSRRSRVLTERNTTKANTFVTQAVWVNLYSFTGLLWIIHVSESADDDDDGWCHAIRFHHDRFANTTIVETRLKLMLDHLCVDAASRWKFNRRNMEIRLESHVLLSIAGNS